MVYMNTAARGVEGQGAAQQAHAWPWVSAALWRVSGGGGAGRPWRVQCKSRDMAAVPQRYTYNDELQNLYIVHFNKKRTKTNREKNPSVRTMAADVWGSDTAYFFFCNEASSHGDNMTIQKNPQVPEACNLS